MKNSKNIENFECMEYICDKIIPITEFEIFNIYFNTRVVDGILEWIFFMVYDIDIHRLNLGQFKNLKFLNEIPFKKKKKFIFLLMNA